MWTNYADRLATWRIGGVASEEMTNDTSYPVLYYNSPRGDNYYLNGRPIIDSTGEEGYPVNATRSIRVYYNRWVVVNLYLDLITCVIYMTTQVISVEKSQKRTGRKNLSC
jgi:hypothetical protein